ncbi:MAG: hypothetical protein M3256_13150 [Actinomycetota bacterium]|nr:hypothetical protein [Actinomycetota bacterium]
MGGGEKLAKRRPLDPSPWPTEPESAQRHPELRWRLPWHLVGAALQDTMMSSRRVAGEKKVEAGVEICGHEKGLRDRAWPLRRHDRAGRTALARPQAAAFAQAIREMLLLSKLVGGEPSTAVGCTGVGDPEVMGRLRPQPVLREAERPRRAGEAA